MVSILQFINLLSKIFKYASKTLRFLDFPSHHQGSKMVNIYRYRKTQEERYCLYYSLTNIEENHICPCYFYERRKYIKRFYIV